MATARADTFKRALLLTASAAFAATAAGLELEPEIALERVFTNNVNLAPAGLEESEQVNRLLPGLRLYHDAARLEVDMDYRLEVLDYTQVAERDEVYQQWTASGTFEAVEQVFFIDADTTRGQQNVDPQERLSNSNIYINANRTDIDTFNIRPYIDTEFGDAARLLLSHQVGQDEFSDETLQDLDFTQTVFRLSGPNRFAPFNWAIDYNATSLEYEAGTIRSANASVTLGYGSPNAGVFIMAGQESDFFNPTVDDLTEERWDVGVNWSGRRGSLRMTRGERSFGSARSMQLAYVLPRGNFLLSWSQAPAAPAILGREQRTTDQTAVGLDRLGRTEIFIQTLKVFEFSLQLPRSDIGINVYEEFRDRQLDALDPTVVLLDEREQGLRVTWNWRVGARTTFNLGGMLARREFEQLQEPADLSQLGLGLTYSLGRRTDLGLDLTVESQEGQTVNAAPYDERRATLRVTRRFY